MTQHQPQISAGERGDDAPLCVRNPTDQLSAIDAVPSAAQSAEHEVHHHGNDDQFHGSALPVGAGGIGVDTGPSTNQQ